LKYLNLNLKFFLKKNLHYTLYSIGNIYILFCVWDITHSFHPLPQIQSYTNVLRLELIDLTGPAGALRDRN
jgi:hypothetical protein